MTNSEKETIMSLRLDMPIGGVNGWGDAGSDDHGNGAMSPPEPLTPDAEVLARLRVILGCHASETVEERAQNVTLEQRERQNKINALAQKVDTLKAEATHHDTLSKTLHIKLEGVRTQLQWEQTSKAERQDKIDQLTANLEAMKAHSETFGEADVRYKNLLRQYDDAAAFHNGFKEGCEFMRDTMAVKS